MCIRDRESVAHDLAGRRHDVADDRTQVVERFDVGHEAVVEDQVVDDVQDGVGALGDQVVTGDHFLQGVGVCFVKKYECYI